MRRTLRDQHILDGEYFKYTCPDGCHVFHVSALTGAVTSAQDYRTLALMYKTQLCARANIPYDACTLTYRRAQMSSNEVRAKRQTNSLPLTYYRYGMTVLVSAWLKGQGVHTANGQLRGHPHNMHTLDMGGIYRLYRPYWTRTADLLKRLTVLPEMPTLYLPLLSMGAAREYIYVDHLRGQRRYSMLRQGARRTEEEAHRAMRVFLARHGALLPIHMTRKTT